MSEQKGVCKVKKIIKLLKIAIQEENKSKITNWNRYQWSIRVIVQIHPWPVPTVLRDQVRADKRKTSLSLPLQFLPALTPSVSFPPTRPARLPVITTPCYFCWNNHYGGEYEK